MVVKDVQQEQYRSSLCWFKLHKNSSSRWKKLLRAWGARALSDSPPYGCAPGVVDFLLVLTELFSLGVSAEAIRANWFKIGDFAPTGAGNPKFQVEGVASHQPFFFPEK